MNRLQQLRETAALSRADLARRSDVTQAVIEQLEEGAHPAQVERAVLVPGQTPVEDIAVILNKLADALGANLIVQGISVTPEELLEPARDDLPARVEDEAETITGEETLPALPLVGISYARPEGDLPPEARSHNETETPDDIDAALGQLAANAQIAASEEAAETGADEVKPEPGPDGPVSPAADTSEPSSGGQAPTGGTETINMAELPDTLPIGVLPDSASFVRTEEVSPGMKQVESNPDQEFASQETQEIYIPPEVRTALPTYAFTPLPAQGTVTATSDDFGNQATQQFELPQDIQRMPGEAEQIDTPIMSPVEAPVVSEAASDAPTLSFDISEARDHQPVLDTTALEKAEMPPEAAFDDEPSSVVMAEDAAVEAAAPEMPGTVEEPETTTAPEEATPDSYEAVPLADMPGPAAAPETMGVASEAHPEPPDMAEVGKEDEAALASTVTTPSGTVESEAQPAYTPPANLGLETAHDVSAVEPNASATIVPSVAPTALELEAATPPQDDALLTRSEPDKLPGMKPYVTPAPDTAEANRYKLPPSTVIPSVIGVVAALGWYAWRSWRRSRAEAERVAPYYKKK